MYPDTQCQIQIVYMPRQNITLSNFVLINLFPCHNYECDNGCITYVVGFPKKIWGLSISLPIIAQNLGLWQIFLQPDRGYMTSSFYYSCRFEYIGSKQSSAEWRKRLPILAKRLEEILYRKFPNKVLLSHSLHLLQGFVGILEIKYISGEQNKILLFHRPFVFLFLYCLSRMTTTIWWRDQSSHNCCLLLRPWSLGTSKINETHKWKGRHHLHPAQIWYIFVHFNF